VWNFRRFLLLTQPIAPVEVRGVLISTPSFGGTGISPIHATSLSENSSLVYTRLYFVEGLAVYELLNYGHKKEGDN